MNKLNLFTLFFILCFSVNAYSHAVVTHSTLEIETVHPNQPSQITLTFNSRIELDLSQIFLVSQGDQMQLVKAENGGKSGQVIIHLPALTPGEYALKFNIFAADGHLSEDIIRFTVADGQ